MRVEFRKTFEKDLRKIREQALLGKIKSIIEATEAAETLDEVANIKKLKGEDGYFRIRLGDYRIGLFLQDEVLLFVRILHRKEFYRYFP
ncbi:plasmid stabilization protein [filamentous cyanobacterium CCT1]|nr:plasmid stabilization protein [filamentous cyanobacterium CCT1]PSN77990.1 plasmid stabilization protein [filamentous cyanobacterium CCP4]